MISFLHSIYNAYTSEDFLKSSYILADEVYINIFSSLGKKSFQAMACTCRGFEILSKDFQIWKIKAIREFGNLVANGAKEPNKNWKQTYEELAKSKEVRNVNIAQVLQTQKKKKTTDDLYIQIFREVLASSGFEMPDPSTHFYPAGQNVYYCEYKTTF
jgi:hypothetical protein